MENVKAIVLSFNIRNKYAHPSIALTVDMLRTIYTNMGTELVDKLSDPVIESYNNNPLSLIQDDNLYQIEEKEYEGVSQEEARDIVRYITKRISHLFGVHEKPFGKKWYMDIELHSELPQDFHEAATRKPYQLERDPDSLNMKLKYFIPLTTPKIAKFYESYLKLDIQPSYNNFVFTVKEAKPYFFDETLYYKGKTFKKQSELKTVCPDIKF